MTQKPDDLDALCARLTHTDTFDAAFRALKQRDDPGLYAELLSGAGWSDFVREAHPYRHL